MTNALVPVTAALNDIVQISMVPFGNAYFNTTQCGRPEYDRGQVGCYRSLCRGSAPASDCFSGALLCQHGSQECFANRLEGCAIAGSTFPDWVPFVACYEGNGDLSPQNAQKCARSAKLNYNKMSACASGSLGTEVDINNAKATLQYSGTWMGTPTVTVEGKTVNNPAEGKNLLNAICKAYSGHDKPEGCK